MTRPDFAPPAPAGGWTSPLSRPPADAVPPVPVVPPRAPVTAAAPGPVQPGWVAPWWMAPTPTPAPSVAWPLYPDRPPSGAVPRTAVRWLVGAVAVLVAVSTLGGVGAVRWLQADQEIADARSRVTLTVPNAWSDVSSLDAGRAVEQGPDGYLVPDLELESLGSEDYVSVYVEDETGQTGDVVHRQTVADLCEAYGCTDEGRADVVRVDGRAALEQVLRHPDDRGSSTTSVVLTVWAGSTVVSAVGESHGATGGRDLTAAAEEMSARLRTLQVR